MVQDKPTYGKGVISLSFPHPIHGKELHLQHTFGIYVIDQVRRRRYRKNWCLLYDALKYAL